MGLKRYPSAVLVLFVLFFFNSCGGDKKSKSDIESVFTQDTLHVGYTYWWPQSGPFIGSCGDELSLVFSGTITNLEEPNDNPGPLYTSQQGTIVINTLYKIKELAKNTYANQRFFISDCFHDLGFEVGDQVLVFCFDYEGSYSIPGRKSLLKLASFDDPLIASIRKYIDADENPIILKNDRDLWVSNGLGHRLESIIECREEMDSFKEIEPSL